MCNPNLRRILQRVKVTASWISALIFSTLVHLCKLLHILLWSSITLLLTTITTTANLLGKTKTLLRVEYILPFLLLEDEVSNLRGYRPLVEVSFSLVNDPSAASTTTRGARKEVRDLSRKLSLSSQLVLQNGRLSFIYSKCFAYNIRN